MIRPTNFSHQWCEFFICIAISLVKLLQINRDEILNIRKKNSQFVAKKFSISYFLLNAPRFFTQSSEQFSFTPQRYDFFRICAKKVQVFGNLHFGVCGIFIAFYLSFVAPVPLLYVQQLVRVGMWQHQEVSEYL